jgi:GNAT superfamily N-acetyltransferase
VALLADDVLGAVRETGLHDTAGYLAAFARIDADPDDLLVVAELDGRVVACAQVTLLTSLSRAGSTRAQVEAVRVASDLRGRQVGEQLMRWVEVWAGARGATLLQLTTDLRRTDAHRFYERLGYSPSHVGMKKPIG